MEELRLAFQSANPHERVMPFPRWGTHDISQIHEDYIKKKPIVFIIFFLGLKTIVYILKREAPDRIKFSSRVLVLINYV